MTQGFRGKVVVITEASEGRSGIFDGARPTSEDDTATTFELFFDLVYVFAAIQVTGSMARAHDALGVFQGLLILTAVVDLIQVRLARQPGPGRNRRRACRNGRRDGRDVRRGPRDPRSLG